MQINKAISGFILSLLLCVVITLGIMFYLDNMTLRGLTDIGTLVSIAILIIGGMSAYGANQNRHEYGSVYVKPMLMNRKSYDQTENDEVAKGAAFGVVLMITAVVWCGLSFLAYYMFG